MCTIAVYNKTAKDDMYRSDIPPDPVANLLDSGITKFNLTEFHLSS